MSSKSLNKGSVLSLEDSVKKSADLLGRIVNKPPLTAKLLSKPPFRYIHDLFSELQIASGWAEGLYTEIEKNSDNVKEKEAKVKYLMKMIDVVGISTGVTVKANPLKIVAGMEVEETNAFFHLLAKAILKKVDCADAVKRVLAGEHQGKKSSSKSKQSIAQPEKKVVAVPKEKEFVQKKGKVAPAKTTSPKQKAKESVKIADETVTSPKQKAKESGNIAEETVQNASKTDLKEVKREENFEEHELSNSRGALQIHRERPATARPPPPKIRSNKPVAEEAITAAPVIFQESVKVDEDDDFIMIDQNSEANSEKVELKTDEIHGGLVRKILETKKELEGEVNEEERLKEKERIEKMPKDKLMARKEIESLMEGIQLLCRSTNPLGKMLDYIQEDVDSMNRELQSWKLEGEKWKGKMDEEVWINNEEISPLTLQLLQIEENIEEQLNKIIGSKGIIMQNEESIQKLIANISQPVK